LWNFPWKKSPECKIARDFHQFEEFPAMKERVSDENLGYRRQKPIRDVLSAL